MRSIGCRTEATARKDRADRQAVVNGLQRRMADGRQARRKARSRRHTGADRASANDAGTRTDEARFDGIFVLSTTATMPPRNAELRYRDLLLGLLYAHIFSRLRHGLVKCAVCPVDALCCLAVSGGRREANPACALWGSAVGAGGPVFA